MHDQVRQRRVELLRVRVAFQQHRPRPRKRRPNLFHARHQWHCSQRHHASHGNSSEPVRNALFHVRAFPYLDQSRGAWAAGCWQRLGWQHGVSSHGGLRLGLSGDNDSSDSIDSYIGLGGTAGSCCGAYSAASGYLAYPWGGYPSPSYAPLQGQIWFK